MPQIDTRYGEVDEVMASARIDMSDPQDLTYLKAVLSAGRSKATRPWKWYNEISEVSNAISRLGKIAGYARVQARWVNADGTMGRVLKTGAAAEIAKRISSPYGGTRGLIDRYITLMKIPGDAYLIRLRDATGNIVGYNFIGSMEIEAASVDGTPMGGTPDAIFTGGQSIQWITLPGTASSGSGALTREVKANDFFGRVWRPSGQYIDLPVSPMRALDTECELLHLLTIGLKGKLASRLALNGLIFIPSEINDVQTGQPTADANPIHDNRVVDRLIKASIANVQNRDSPQSAIPIFMSGPAVYGEAIRFITMDQLVAETDMKLRAELKDRILEGLDVQKQKTSGNGEGNHFQAWADGDDEMRVNIKPDLESLMWTLTRMILHREMQEQGLDAAAINRTVLWYDLTAANTNVNAAEDGRQAFDRALVGDAAARRMSGIDEADAPSNIEYLRNIGRKMAIPYLATFGMPEAEKFDWEKLTKSAKTGPNADSPADDPEAGPGTPRGGPGQGDSDTPDRLRPQN